MKSLRFVLVAALVALMCVSLLASDTKPAPTGGTAVITGTASKVDAGAKKFSLGFTTRDGKAATTQVNWNATTEMTAPPADGQKVSVQYNDVSSARSRTGVPPTITAQKIRPAS